MSHFPFVHLFLILCLDLEYKTQLFLEVSSITSVLEHSQEIFQSTFWCKLLINLLFKSTLTRNFYHMIAVAYSMNAAKII